MDFLLDEELIETQTIIDNSIHSFTDLGLSVEVGDDFETWMAYMEGVPDPLGVSATFNPNISDIKTGTAFWVALKDSVGGIAACHAHRVIETAEFTEEVRTWRLFSRTPRLDWQPVHLHKEARSIGISGKVGFGGGLWVHPKWRGAAISGVLSRFSRNLSLRHFGIDWYVGLMVDKVGFDHLGLAVFGLAHNAMLMSGLYPGRNKRMDIQLLYISREEIIRQNAAEVRDAKFAGKRKLAG
jgi:hypothetical protein